MENIGHQFFKRKIYRNLLWLIVALVLFWLILKLGIEVLTGGWVNIKCILWNTITWERNSTPILTIIQGVLLHINTLDHPRIYSKPIITTNHGQSLSPEGVTPRQVNRHKWTEPYAFSPEIIYFYLYLYPYFFLVL